VLCFGAILYATGLAWMAQDPLRQRQGFALCPPICVNP
jgi:hypothetical protein